jgi:hypothetical protein
MWYDALAVNRLLGDNSAIKKPEIGGSVPEVNGDCSKEPTLDASYLYSDDLWSVCFPKIQHVIPSMAVDPYDSITPMMDINRNALVATWRSKMFVPSATF